MGSEMCIRDRLRAVSDFEYEFQLAGMNKKLNSKMKMQTLHRLQQQLQSKLPNTDILRKFKQL